MSEHILKWNSLYEYEKQLFMAEGVPEDEAGIIVDHLLEAEFSGLASHGISRTNIYMERLQKKVVNAKSSYKIENETSSILKWNGCNSMGMVTGKKVMECCIQKAKDSGICFATVNNSNHFGMAGYYARMAAREGMIGICGTNAPPNIAPWGSYKAYLGTNPLAIAAPSKEKIISLDMAPCVVAKGKVILAAKQGKSIPEGWALTAEGKPTTNAQEAMKGTMLPIGGPKGYGLALFTDILSGVLSGAQFGPYLNNMFTDFINPQDVGHFFCAIDISKFIGKELFEERIQTIVSDIKSLPCNPGVDELFMPGEIELNKMEENLANGVKVSDAVYEELTALGKTYKIDMEL